MIESTDESQGDDIAFGKEMNVGFQRMWVMSKRRMSKSLREQVTQRAGLTHGGGSDYQKQGLQEDNLLEKWDKLCIQF